VAQKASPISKLWCFKYADLTLTSFPHFVSRFKQQGVQSEYLRLAFGERILKVLPEQVKKYQCTFIGGITPAHTKGLQLLNHVADAGMTDFFGYGRETLSPSSALYKRHHGEIWGKRMYATMMQSRMTINRHIDVAENFANNMRLYEATGSGSLLLTDEKLNLAELFELNREVVPYSSSGDLIDKIRYYSSHPDEAALIARAGQIRTLKDHTYTKRMGEMINLLSKYL
jgi:hypothetical protein